MDHTTRQWIRKGKQDEAFGRSPPLRYSPEEIEAWNAGREEARAKMRAEAAVSGAVLPDLDAATVDAWMRAHAGER